MPRKLAAGHRYYVGNDNLKIAIQFKPDVFEQLRERARTFDTSVSEQVRRLVAIGLESQDGGS